MAAPIIMVPGAFCGGWAFDRFREPFEAAGHQCAAVDLPGHKDRGDRVAVTGVSMSRYAAEVAQLAARSEQAPILIGHSLGGLIAAMAASRTQTAGVIMLAPSAPWGVAGASMEETVSAVGLYSLGAYWAQAIDPDYSLAQEFSLDKLPKLEREGAFARMVPESGRALWETLNWWLDPFMTTRIAPEPISAPVLAMAGGLDRIHPPATVQRTALLLGADFQTMPQMSHWLIGEPGWDQVAEACLEWMVREKRAAA
jgi:pimeloyl-ACP methyl ester carboxylesterase